MLDDEACGYGSKQPRSRGALAVIGRGEARRRLLEKVVAEEGRRVNCSVAERAGVGWRTKVEGGAEAAGRVKVGMAVDGRRFEGAKGEKLFEACS